MKEKQLRKRIARLLERRQSCGEDEGRRIDAELDSIEESIGSDEFYEVYMDARTIARGVRTVV